jgi:hypothetical protein
LPNKELKLLRQEANGRACLPTDVESVTRILRVLFLQTKFVCVSGFMLS